LSEPLRPEHPRIRELLTDEFRPVLWGELRSVQAPELFAIVANGRKTGVLLVFRDGIERVFGFCDGDLVYGFSTASAEADDARESVLALVRDQPPGGTFTFLRAPAPAVPRSMEPVRTEEIVLDAVRKLDETRQLTG
jgi:Domain of unknown function (DUF4388)